jgi:DNA-binding CsgD family transcriptional regulator
MSGPTRDALILRLRRQGRSYREIGKAVGMSPSSVGHALSRIAEGRPERGPRS